MKGGNTFSIGHGSTDVCVCHPPAVNACVPYFFPPSGKGRKHANKLNDICSNRFD